MMGNGDKLEVRNEDWWEKEKWWEGCGSSENPEIRVELGGALRMNKRYLINSNPANFRMRLPRDKRGRWRCQAKNGS